MFDVVNHLMQVCDYMLTEESRSHSRSIQGSLGKKTRAQQMPPSHFKEPVS